MRIDAESETLLPVAFDTTQVTSKANRSNPQPGDPCHPLAAEAHPPAIAFSCKDHGADAGEVAPTLRSMEFDESHANGGGQVAVALPILKPGSRTGKSTDDKRCSDGIGQDGDPMFTLQGSRTHGVAIEEPYTLAIRGRGDTSRLEARQDGTANALMTPNGGRGGVGVGAIASTYAVRRLTAIECSRLQGFPDTWCHIPLRPRKIDAEDAAYYMGHGLECWQQGEQWYTRVPCGGPIYKAFGNSMAVPTMRWILRRIQAVHKIVEEATL